LGKTRESLRFQGKNTRNYSAIPQTPIIDTHTHNSVAITVPNHNQRFRAGKNINEVSAVAAREQKTPTTLTQATTAGNFILAINICDG